MVNVKKYSDTGEKTQEEKDHLAFADSAEQKFPEHEVKSSSPYSFGIIKNSSIEALVNIPERKITIFDEKNFDRASDLAEDLGLETQEQWNLVKKYGKLK